MFVHLMLAQLLMYTATPPTGKLLCLISGIGEDRRVIEKLDSNGVGFVKEEIGVYTLETLATVGKIRTLRITENVTSKESALDELDVTNAVLDFDNVVLACKVLTGDSEEGTPNKEAVKL